MVVHYIISGERPQVHGDSLHYIRRTAASPWWVPTLYQENGRKCVVIHYIISGERAQVRNGSLHYIRRTGASAWWFITLYQENGRKCVMVHYIMYQENGRKCVVVPKASSSKEGSWVGLGMIIEI